MRRLTFLLAATALVAGCGGGRADAEETFLSDLRERVPSVSDVSESYLLEYARSTCRDPDALLLLSGMEGRALRPAESDHVREIALEHCEELGVG